MEKLFHTKIVLDYKNGRFKVLKRLPKTLKPSEIPIDFKLTIDIPEKKEISVEGKIELSDQKIVEMALNEL